MKTMKRHPYSYFDLLDVGPNASDEDVKAAYRKLAIKFHPDHNPGNKKISSARFHTINEAYKALSTRERRQHYYNWLRTQQNIYQKPANNNNSHHAKAPWFMKWARVFLVKSTSS